MRLLINQREDVKKVWEFCEAMEDCSSMQDDYSISYKEGYDEEHIYIYISHSKGYQVKLSKYYICDPDEFNEYDKLVDELNEDGHVYRMIYTKESGDKMNACEFLKTLKDD